MGRNNIKRKGKERKEEMTGEQRAKKLTCICSNRLFTFIASYTYIGKNDCAPILGFPPTAPPPPLASWTESPRSRSLSLPFPPREVDVLFDNPDPMLRILFR